MLCEKLPKLAIHLGQLFFQLCFYFYPQCCIQNPMGQTCPSSPSTGSSAFLLALLQLILIYIFGILFCLRDLRQYLFCNHNFYHLQSQVLFRYALALLTNIEDKVLQQKDSMAIFNTIKMEMESGLDTKRITQIAFHDINPFPIHIIRNKRDHHAKIYQVV